MTTWKYDPDTLGVNLPEGLKLRFVNRPNLKYRTREEEAERRAKAAQLVAAAPDMLDAIGGLRALMTDKVAGIQLTGSMGSMKKVKAVFDKLEMSYRKAEGQS